MATTMEATPTSPAAPAAGPAPTAGDKRRTLILAAVGAVVVVAGTVWFLVESGRRKAAFAERALTNARQVAEQGNLPLAATEFQKIAQNYAGTSAAQQATISLMQVRIINGQAELAAVGLRDFLAKSPDPQFVAPAQALLGAALENAKKYPEAAEAYRAASDAATVDYLKAEYLLGAARAYAVAGKRDLAEQAYREITGKFDKTPSSTEAKVRLAELTGGKM